MHCFFKLQYKDSWISTYCNCLLGWADFFKLLLDSVQYIQTDVALKDWRSTLSRTFISFYKSQKALKENQKFA